MISKETQKRIVELRKEGYILREIAYILNITEETTRKYLKKEGMNEKSTRFLYKTTCPYCQKEFELLYKNLIKSKKWVKSEWLN